MKVYGRQSLDLSVETEKEAEVATNMLDALCEALLEYKLRALSGETRLSLARRVLDQDMTSTPSLLSLCRNIVDEKQETSEAYGNANNGHPMS